MKTIVRFTLAAVVVGLATASCTKSVSNDTVYTMPTGSVSQLYDQTPPPMRLHDYGYPTDYPGSYNSVSDYNFVRGGDIELFYKASIALRMTILKEFYSQMNLQDFNKAAFTKEYVPLLSPNVRAEARKFAATVDDDNALGGWQALKPLPRLDAAQTKYLITYEGDDWFSIKPAGDDNGVRLRVVLATKELQPVVAEVENPAFGVCIGLGTGNDLGTGYTLAHSWEYGIYNNKKRNHTFWNYVAHILYSGCLGTAKDRTFITETELLAYADRLGQKREQLLREFYADLTAPDFSKQTFSQKYDKVVIGAVANAMQAAHGNAAKSNPYGRWAPFEPKDKKAYTLAYDEQDWFKVYGTDAANPDVYVQTIFYGKEMRPLIVGLYNGDLNINVQEDFGDTRNGKISRWELRKHW